MQQAIITGLVGLAIFVVGAAVGMWVYYLATRQEGPRVPEAQQIVDADAFTEQLHAVPVEHEPSPVAPSSLRLERPPPLPPNVFGSPLGRRQPLIAEAVVGWPTGRHARRDGEECPILAELCAGDTTREFRKIVEPLREVEHV